MLKYLGLDYCYNAKTSKEISEKSKKFQIIIK